MSCATAASGPSAPVLDVEAAIVAYVAQNDYVSFVEIKRHLEPFMAVSGDCSLTMNDAGTAVLWSGMSEILTRTLARLLADGRLSLHPSSPTIYMIDGGLLDLPIAKRIGDLKSPRWVVATLRLPSAKRSKGVRPRG